MQPSGVQVMDISADAPLAGRAEYGFQLREISIRRFRCIFEINDLPLQQALTIVAGQNDGGKSSFLHAIAFLLGQQNLDDRDLSNQAAEDERLEVEGVFVPFGSSDEAESITVRAYCGAQFKRVVQLRTWVHPDLNALPESMTLNELREATAKLLPERVTSNSKQPYIDALDVWLHEQPSSDLVEAWSNLPKEIEDRLPKLQVFSSTTAVDPVSAIRQLIRARSQVILQSERYSERLNDIECELVEELCEGVKFIEDRIKVHCDDLEGVNIHPAYDFSRVQPETSVEFIRSGPPVDYTKVGEGRQRKTTIAVYEADLDALKHEEHTSSYILIYDEPDSHLDYVSQKKVARILEAQAALRHVQVVVATHSKNLIDFVPLNSVLSFSLNDHLQTEVKILASPDHDSELEFQAEMYASLGLANSILLDDKVFLVVEGSSEIHSFPILFRIVSNRSMVASGIQMVNLGGSGSTRVFIDRLKNDWKKEMIVCVDADCRKNCKLIDFFSKTGFVEGIDLFYVGKKELEDEFSDEIWTETLLRDYPVADDQGAWESSILAKVRKSDKFSSSLLSQVHQRTQRSDVTKVDIMRSVAMTSKEQGMVPRGLQKCMDQLVQMIRTDD